MRFGGLEMGGTKMVCAIGNEKGEVLDRRVIGTSEAEKTLSELAEYFTDRQIDALGIGSFGPIELNRRSERYGYITSTPKPGWANTDVLGHFRFLNVPIGFDTDVNAACLGEAVYGAGKGLNSVIYGTVGTGIGFGVYLEGKLLHGLMHPETGHMLVERQEEDRDFTGACPYHDNCLEAFASGPAIEKRWGRKADELYDKAEVWELEARYLGQALANCVMCYSPERIILGGGVMHVPGLIELVRKETAKALNGYIRKDEITMGIDEYIVLPELNDDAGIVGAMQLGKLEMENELS